MKAIPGIGASGRHRIKSPHRGRSPWGSSAARGYTLLEVLVAFTLLAIGLGILLSILSGGVHAIARSSDSTRASLYAESLFDSLGADQRLRPNSRMQGSFEGGRYRWTLDITRMPAPGAGPQPGGPPAAPAQPGNADNVLLHVVLKMQWNGGGSGNTLQVDTLRAYAPPQEVGQ